jgi:hypothetical protein
MRSEDLRAAMGRPGAHLFVDESKERDYVVVAAAIAPSDVAGIRAQLRALVLPGQRRLHMTKESDARKQAIAAAVTAADVHAIIYTAKRAGRTELDARAACLDALVADAASIGAHRLVLERDDSVARWDNQRLIELTRKHECRDTLTYQLMRSQEDMMLCLPDAIAWCWTKGDHWRRRITSTVLGHRVL